MKKLLVVFLLVFAISCGGSTGTTNDGGTTGGTSTATTKSYQALSSLSLGVMQGLQASASLPYNALGDITLKAVGSWTCSPSDDAYACTITDSEGGYCEVVVTNDGDDNLSFTFTCDNYTYTYDSETVVIDGTFAEAVTQDVVESESSMEGTFSFEVTTPGGFDITVGSDSISYGSDFSLAMVMNMTITVDEGDYDLTMTMTFTATGTVNGEDVSDSITMTCAGDMTTYSCTES